MNDRLRSTRLDLSRRTLLRCFGASAVVAFGLPMLTRPALADPVFADYPFQLGVASGDPAADGFVIWTRLAPDPFAIGHGMPSQAVEVNWEVAEDPGFRTVVQKGVAIARPELGHAVHVEVAGLAPDRPYHYRFVAGSERSLHGRARTLPAAGQAVDRVRFAVAGCQHYEQGFFTAYRDLAAKRPDFVFCYGDYIYEGRSSRIWNSSAGPVENPRQHVGGEIYSIDDYRRRYAQVKMDADLQAAHAAAPWFVTWDDHEVDNNWVADIDQDGTPEPIFALRRQMAMQAYYEHMPLRASSLPIGRHMQIYRHARWGNLLDLNVLDTRQYRTDQPCDDRWGTPCPDVTRREAEVLGARQHAWLMGNLTKSQARWNVLAQQIMVMDLDRNPAGPEPTENLDSWAGYRVPRARLLEDMRRARVANAIVLTGDEHQHYAGELHVDGRRPAAQPVATEFVATSISSGGDGEDQRAQTIEIQRHNPQLKFHNSRRGYLLCDVTPERWETDFVVLDKVSARGGTSSSAAKLVVASGDQRLQQA